MAISLASLRRAKADQPPRTMIHAGQGLGKTSLGAEFPAAVFLQFEEGTPAGVELDSFGLLSSYDEGIEALKALHEGEHSFQTIVVDSVDKLEPLVWANVCQLNNWQSIESPGYGKGYVEADYQWRDFLAWLLALRRDRGMAIVLLAHSDVMRFDDPQTQSYSRYVTRLHKRAAAILEDEMDAILFINTDVTIEKEDKGFNKSRARGIGGGTRWIFTEQRPAFMAKNRYGMPPKIMFKKGDGFNELAKWFPGGEAEGTDAAASETVDTETAVEELPPRSTAPRQKAAA